MIDTTLLGVVGRPILHSRSPAIFAGGFREGGLHAHYLRMHVHSHGEALWLARQLGMDGINVTAPFKEGVAGAVDQVARSALAVGAVNTVVFDSQGATGHNTDPDGVAFMLRRSRVGLGKQGIAVLGAGGAARAVAHCLKRDGFTDVVVVNRTEARGRALAQAFGFEFIPWDDAMPRVRAAELVFSCLSPEAEAPSRWFRLGHRLLDANYQDDRLARVARDRGCTYTGGLDWLLAQAAAGFELMMGRSASHRALREGLDSWAPFSQERNLVLCGMMGTGKSATGRALASYLGRPFVDTDERIAEQAGMPIPRIFAKLGEPRFRELEAQAVAAACEERGAVIALGGGALIDPTTRGRVVRASTGVWLWASPETCARRASDTGRPLLAHGDAEVRIRQLMKARQDHYAAVSELVIATENTDPAEVARSIADEFGLAWSH